MKTLSLKITAGHIEQAVRKDSHHCMIADAIRSAWPQGKYISVDIQAIRVSDLKSSQRFVWMTPAKAQLALIAFDQGDPVQPFSVRLTKGFVRKVGWQANHPTTSRKGRKYKASGKTRIVAKKEREFGLRKLQA